MRILPLKGVVWFGKMLKVSLLAVAVMRCGLLQGPLRIVGGTICGYLVRDVVTEQLMFVKTALIG